MMLFLGLICLLLLLVVLFVMCWLRGCLFLVLLFIRFAACCCFPVYGFFVFDCFVVISC